MLYMKEQRPKIAAEFTLKESAAINQILGKRWHALEKSEQAKYYELARKERALHMQMYPGWSARDNYAGFGKRKKKKKDKNSESNPKKCRARYGLDRQEQWCKPCRRKKKCIRFIIGADGEAKEVPENDQIDNDEDDSDENHSDDIDSKENLQQEIADQSSNYQSFTEQLQRSLSPSQHQAQTTHSQSAVSLNSRIAPNSTLPKDQNHRGESNLQQNSSKSYSLDNNSASKKKQTVVDKLKPKLLQDDSSCSLSTVPDGSACKKIVETHC